MSAPAPSAEQRLHPDRLREVFGSWPTGVAVVAAVADGTPLGMTVNSFTTVSLDPVLVAVSAAKQSRTWNRLREARRLGISVLAAHQEPVGRQFAAPADDRFRDVPWSATTDGAIVLDDAVAWLDVEVARLVDAGDHELALLAVHDLQADHTRRPLVFHGRAFTGLAAPR